MAFAYRGVVWEKPLLASVMGVIVLRAVAGVEFCFKCMLRMCFLVFGFELNRLCISIHVACG